MDTYVRTNGPYVRSNKTQHETSLEHEPFAQGLVPPFKTHNQPHKQVKQSCVYINHSCIVLKCIQTFPTAVRTFSLLLSFSALDRYASPLQCIIIQCASHVSPMRILSLHHFPTRTHILASNHWRKGGHVCWSGSHGNPWELLLLFILGVCWHWLWYYC